MLKPTATIELVYRDETGSTSAVVTNVPVSSSIASLDAVATALASLIAPITDAVLIKVRYSFRAVFEYDISEAGSNPIVFAGLFLFSTTTPSPDDVIIIHGIKDDILLDTGVTADYGVDLTDSRVIAFLDAIIDLGASNPFGDAITDIAAAYRVSRV